MHNRWPPITYCVSKWGLIDCARLCTIDGAGTSRTIDRAQSSRQRPADWQTNFRGKFALPISPALAQLQQFSGISRIFGENSLEISGKIVWSCGGGKAWPIISLRLIMGHALPRHSTRPSGAGPGAMPRKKDCQSLYPAEPE